MKILILLIFIISNSWALDCSERYIKDELRINKVYAETLSGGIFGFETRISNLLNIYEDSNRNFIFPLIALHGAKWAGSYLEDIDSISNSLSYLPYSKRIVVLNKVKTLSYELKRINYDVFKEVYGVYNTVKNLKECNDFQAIGVNKILSNGIKLSLKSSNYSNKEKLALYKEIFRFEQYNVVHPQIIKLKKKLKLNRLERYLFLRPKVKFSYFPKGKSIKFTNFFSINERIKFGLKAAEIALEVGEQIVVDSIKLE